MALGIDARDAIDLPERAMSRLEKLDGLTASGPKQGRDSSARSGLPTHPAPLRRQGRAQALELSPHAAPCRLAHSWATVRSRTN